MHINNNLQRRETQLSVIMEIYVVCELAKQPAAVILEGKKTTVDELYKEKSFTIITFDIIAIKCLRLRISDLKD